MTASRASDFLPLISTEDWGGRATRAEVNLDAIESNVRALRAAARSRELLSVVKSDGYGHGSVAVSRSALAAGADRVGVYTVDEGIALRRAGIEAPVLVFGPFTEAEAAEIARHGLTPTLTSIEAAKALQRQASGARVRYHLKVDTGLTRNGVLPQDVLPLLAAMRHLTALELEGVFTHFASSDEADKTSTYAQMAVYRETVADIESAGFEIPMKHVAASGAIHDLPDLHLDMVRCGISVYGYYPSPYVSRAIPLTPALQLVSAVARIHLARAGTGVGYGHEFKCEKDTPIVLVPIGYGDGLPRTFGLGRGTVLINGREAPVVGRVSMDQITVDTTAVGDVRVGDPVTLIGEQLGAVQTADDLANKTDTISYDILCGIMPRVPRVYVKGGEIVGVLRSLPGAPRQIEDMLPATS